MLGDKMRKYVDPVLLTITEELYGTILEVTLLQPLHINNEKVGFRKMLSCIREDFQLKFMEVAVRLGGK